MATEFNRTLKDCCLCQYWTGNRELSLNKHVRVESGIVKGICLKEKREKQANQTACCHFIKWDKLP